MLSAILGTSRPQFLILAPLCISVAMAYAHYLYLPIAPLDIMLCYLAALFAHASVNMLNEYHDNLSGLDHLTQRTPFNGGSGVLQQLPATFDALKIGTIVRSCAIGLLLITIAIGLYFVWQRGLLLLLIGLIATASVWLYTPKINQMPLVCLLAPGFGFGVTFVVGSFIAVSGELDTGIWLLSIPLFLQVNNLLLLNQFPDKSADEQCGRQHLIIKYGEITGKNVYVTNLLLLILATVALVDWFDLGLAGLLFAIPIMASLRSLRGLNQYITNKHLQSFIPALASNVFATLSYPAILVGLLVWLR